MQALHINGNDLTLEDLREVVYERRPVLLAEGETTHIVTDAQLQRRELPAKYLEAFARALG